MSSHTAPHDADRPGPDPAHRRPEGVSDATVRALGTLSEALETVERARGHLYAFHQLTGGADRTVGESVHQLRAAGHLDLAELVEREIVGRNVLPGRWTFQVVEEYNATYYRPFTAVEEQVRDVLVAGREHVHEAELKETRRTHGHPDHTAAP
ncbi:hypothetical protein OG422_01145 [Streptomyces sp. NBC_01525]|uniref:Uncharacterized protein n=1 Tax=Streptomyces benahoarensis TaxID=2595054 RepID=A0A553ZLW8_9ACTN|nr:hypothetical protein [Streptomyces benahoarensis]TSB26759.1 hypothetical protein FNJ62_10495 [Streptomyces benahoarensis]TSB42430.1 hypothetical protein FNZ23_09920 [Streptomyces benahoarensis]